MLRSPAFPEHAAVKVSCLAVCPTGPWKVACGRVDAVICAVVDQQRRQPVGCQFVTPLPDKSATEVRLHT